MRVAFFHAAWDILFLNKLFVFLLLLHKRTTLGIDSLQNVIYKTCKLFSSVVGELLPITSRPELMSDDPF